MSPTGQGALNMSRSLGDPAYKQPHRLVSCEPTVKSIELTCAACCLQLWALTPNNMCQGANGHVMYWPDGAAPQEQACAHISGAEAPCRRGAGKDLADGAEYHARNRETFLEAKYSVCISWLLCKTLMPLGPQALRQVAHLGDGRPVGRDAAGRRHRRRQAGAGRRQLGAQGASTGRRSHQPGQHRRAGALPLPCKPTCTV